MEAYREEPNTVFVCLFSSKFVFNARLIVTGLCI